MKELPTPTLPLSGLMTPGFLRRKPVTAAAPTTATARLIDTETAAYEVVWARHAHEVQEAQRLRHEVFVEEMGARLSPIANTPAGHDADVFDAYCEHLLVRTLERDDQPSMVVGTYRVLTPGAARRAGGYYSETEFDLTRLRNLRSRMAELGRSCVHAEHRSGAVILSLWSALARFMRDNGLEAMVGCASVSMRDGGHLAASLWERLRREHLADVDMQVRPRLALPVDDLDTSLVVDPPALIKGYLRCGAKVLGAPAWDPDFNTADLPMLLRLGDLPSRYRRHFLGME